MPVYTAEIGKCVVLGIIRAVLAQKRAINDAISANLCNIDTYKLIAPDGNETFFSRFVILYRCK
jgi:hypothetical protein